MLGPGTKRGMSLITRNQAWPWANEIYKRNFWPILVHIFLCMHCRLEDVANNLVKHCGHEICVFFFELLAFDQEIEFQRMWRAYSGTTNCWGKIMWISWFSFYQCVSTEKWWCLIWLLVVLIWISRLPYYYLRLFLSIFFFGLLSQPTLTQMMMIDAFWFTYRVSFVGTNRCYRPHILKAFAHRLILICVFVCTNAPSTYETFILNQSV